VRREHASRCRRHCSAPRRRRAIVVPSNAGPIVVQVEDEPSGQRKQLRFGYRFLPSGRRPYRPCSPRREAQRPSRPAVHESRDVFESQDRQGARHHRAAPVARPRRRGDRVRRRELTTLLSGAAAVWPLAARSKPAMPVVGFVSPGLPDGSAPIPSALHTLPRCCF
jgi:hypothetical protein